MKKRTIITVALMISAGIASYYHYPICAKENKNKNAEQIAVVFDLGDVVFNPSKLSAFWQLGPKNVIFSLMSRQSIEATREKFYDILNKIHKTNGNPWGVGDGRGRDVPAILVEWVRGDYPNQQILDTVCNEIDTHPEWFASRREQQLIRSLSQFMFDPVKLAKACKPIPEMVHFIEECKVKGYKLYVLSNWDAESFDLLAEKYPDLFGLFDGIVISGKVHAVKPCQEIYSLITDKVPAHKCVFIDDQPVNVKAAKKAGMHGIVAKQKRTYANKTPDMKKLRAKFEKLEDRLCFTERRSYLMYSAIDTVVQ